MINYDYLLRAHTHFAAECWPEGLLEVCRTCYSNLRIKFIRFWGFCTEKPFAKTKKYDVNDVFKYVSDGEGGW